MRLSECGRDSSSDTQGEADHRFVLAEVVRVDWRIPAIPKSDERRRHIRQIRGEHKIDKFDEVIHTGERMVQRQR